MMREEHKRKVLDVLKAELSKDTAKTEVNKISSLGLVEMTRERTGKTIESIKRNAADIGLLIVNSYPNCQGYKIETTGPTDRKGIEVDGLWMVAEKWEEVIAAVGTENSNLP